MIISVFTEKYNSIQKRLINSAIVEYNGNIVQVSAQWDTGATGTCISKGLVQKLELLPTGMVNVHTPSGIGTMNKYMINLVLNKELRIMNLPVMDSEIGKQGIDILIGMDIISLGDFAISNFEGKTQFSFRIPSQEHVEYHR
jgi:hypothetical protein